MSSPSMSSLTEGSLTKLDLFEFPLETRNSVPHDVLVKGEGRIQLWYVSGKEEAQNTM